MSNDFSDLKNKVCVVTGGCGAFGNIFASSLLKAGAKIAIIDYKKGRCDDCAQGLAQKAGKPG
jgi:NAD(P)-dependent dehydrogenase (short-subunit alcohol dehydrogenase family)